MDVVLHIGPHKTGSTYIQHALAGNRGALEGEGVVYPTFGIPPKMHGHHSLAHEADIYLAPEQIAKLKTEIGERERVAFSAEGLCNWSNQNFTAFADLLGASRVLLVYYLRDPFDQFYSYWKERVKQGQLQSLPEWFMENFGDPHRSFVLNPLVHLRRYRELDERFELRLIPYETLRTRGEDIVQPLWREVLEIPNGFATPDERQNRSLSTEATEFLRMLIDRYLARNPGVAGRVVRHAFTRQTRSWWLFRKSNLVAEAEAAMETYAAGLSRTLSVSRQCNFYRSLIDQLQKDFAGSLVGTDGSSLYDQDESHLEYYDRADLMSLAPLAEAIEGIATRIERSRFVETAPAEQVV
ncbi:MAG: hypothetical protein AAF415_13535 [Pseudomonadota bacterium]